MINRDIPFPSSKECLQFIKEKRLNEMLVLSKNKLVLKSIFVKSRQISLLLWFKIIYMYCATNERLKLTDLTYNFKFNPSKSWYILQLLRQQKYKKEILEVYKFILDYIKHPTPEAINFKFSFPKYEKEQIRREKVRKLVEKFNKKFPNEKACYKWIKRKMYPNGINCPFCVSNNCFERHEYIKGYGWYICKKCNRDFNIFFRSFFSPRVSLIEYLKAICLFSARVKSRLVRKEVKASRRTVYRIKEKMKKYPDNPVFKIKV